jgi:hypothetical protein
MFAHCFVFCGHHTGTNDIAPTLCRHSRWGLRTRLLETTLLQAMGGRLGRVHTTRGQVALLLRLRRTGDLHGQLALLHTLSNTGGLRGQVACQGLSTLQVGRTATRSRGGKVRALHTLRDMGTPGRNRTSDVGTRL